ncbi:MAG: hypothetical protein WAW42_01360, partial [Candidatus Competibacteraceae bacterium]
MIAEPICFSLAPFLHSFIYPSSSRVFSPWGAIQNVALQHSFSWRQPRSIASLYRLWSIQVPMRFFKIKNLFIEEIKKATFNLIKSLIFK